MSQQMWRMLQNGIILAFNTKTTYITMSARPCESIQGRSFGSNSLFYIVTKIICSMSTSEWAEILLDTSVDSLVLSLYNRAHFFALWRLATSNSYRTMGLTFGVGRCTAMNAKDDFCTALLQRVNDFIKFPTTEAETGQSIQEFQDITRFPQIIGALEGSYIPIRVPKEVTKWVC